jgi:large subunit ribosomal protein L30
VKEDIFKIKRFKRTWLISNKSINMKPKTTTEKKESKLKIVETKENKLLAIIRIKGEVKVKPDVDETLYRLRLRRKYTCVLLNPENKNFKGMIDVVKHSVAFGEIEKETLEKLMKLRGKKIDKKDFDSAKVTEELFSGKKLEELGFKPFFRLHPPRKGIKSKLQYPKGVLGNNNKDINKLIERML